MGEPQRADAEPPGAWGVPGRTPEQGSCWSGGRGAGRAAGWVAGASAERVSSGTTGWERERPATLEQPTGEEHPRARSAGVQRSGDRSLASQRCRCPRSHCPHHGGLQVIHVSLATAQLGRDGKKPLSQGARPAAGALRLLKAPGFASRSWSGAAELGKCHPVTALGGWGMGRALTAQK